MQLSLHLQQASNQLKFAIFQQASDEQKFMQHCNKRRMNPKEATRTMRVLLAVKNFQNNQQSHYIIKYCLKNLDVPFFPSSDLVTAQKVLCCTHFQTIKVRNLMTYKISAKREKISRIPVK